MDIQKRSPHQRNPDKAGFLPRYIAAIDETAVEGAEIAIERLDARFGARAKAPGWYQADYEEVRSAYQAVLDSAPKPRPRPTGLRWTALVLAVLLGALTVFLATLMIVPWLVICAFRNQSGLLTAAETEVLFSIVDFRPTIHSLVNYWRNR